MSRITIEVELEYEPSISSINTRVQKIKGEHPDASHFYIDVKGNRWDEGYHPVLCYYRNQTEEEIARSLALSKQWEEDQKKRR